jgi:hypothetical protein
MPRPPSFWNSILQKLFSVQRWTFNAGSFSLAPDSHGYLWIAKFPSSKDEKNTGAWEMILNHLAHDSVAS